jgi:hypothetical protein
MKRHPTYRLPLPAKLCELQHTDRSAAARVAVSRCRARTRTPDCLRASF